MLEQVSKKTGTLDIQIVLESLVYFIAYMAHLVMGYYFYALWIFLILLGRQMVLTEKFSLKKLAHSMVVSTPIGVLSATASYDMFQYPESICAVIGCAVAISAQRILDGEWFKPLMEALIEKIKR